jgi:hypothetical protein
MVHKGSAETVLDQSPTTHAMLIVWGHFARAIGLLDRLAQVPIRQKTVLHAPQAKLLELFIGLLSGMEYLTDLSEGAAPLVLDREVARAWNLEAMADASSVSRTLKASDDATLTALQATLDDVSQPFVDRAVDDLRERNETLTLDADLTGRPVSSSSGTYPGAAFGYMDGEIRLGYQLAEICLHTRLFGRQWLSARHHPGNRVSSECLLELVQDAECRLGCHPRRRTELLEQRIAACEQSMAEWERLALHQEQRATVQTERLARLTEQISAGQRQIQRLQETPVSTRQAGAYSALNRAQRQVAGWHSQQARAEGQREHAGTIAASHRERAQAQAAEGERLRERCERLRQENARQPQAPRCKLRIDAGFGTGENLTALLELGYEIETKSGNAALVRTLQNQVCEATPWTRVGKNAEMIGWTLYRMNTCPYPLTVGLERFHTPKGLLHAVLIRDPGEAPTACPDLLEWFHAYNGRQTIEAGNKEEKTTFKVQHLMSRSPAGVRIQAMFTVFAANFVRWAQEWVRPRVEQSSPRFEGALSSPKRLVRVAANSPATIDRSEGRLRVRFSPLSSFAGVVVRLVGAPERQLCLPLFQSDHFWTTGAIRAPVAQDLR